MARIPRRLALTVTSDDLIVISQSLLEEQIRDAIQPTIKNMNDAILVAKAAIDFGQQQCQIAEHMSIENLKLRHALTLLLESRRKYEEYARRILAGPVQQ